GGPLWLGLELEPGAILRPIPFQGISLATGRGGGAFLGAGLTLSFGHRIPRSPGPCSGRRNPNLSPPPNSATSTPATPTGSRAIALRRSTTCAATTAAIARSPWAAALS